MSKKIKLVISSQMILFIFIISTSQFSVAMDPSWEEGVFYPFNFVFIYKHHQHDMKNDIFDEYEIENKDEYVFNITYIDNSMQWFHTIIFDSHGTSSVWLNYNVDDFADNVLTISNMFDVDYEWDFEHNQTVLTDFDFHFFPLYFIDPNWTTYNSRFADVFNGSEIVATVADPYEPITHNFTLQDVLSLASDYSIMGQNDLALAKEKFTDNNINWTFYFDFSNAIKDNVFNTSLGFDSYVPYETYTIDLGFDYSPGGILDQFRYNFVYEIIKDEVFRHYEVVEEANTGGFPTVETPGLTYLLAIPAIFTIVLVVKYTKKRKM